jgi:hypothetical protein
MRRRLAAAIVAPTTGCFKRGIGRLSPKLRTGPKVLGSLVAATSDVGGRLRLRLRATSIIAVAHLGA